MHHATRTARTVAAALLAAVAIVAMSSPSSAADTAPRLTGVVNVNTASSEELQLLPGVGEARAQALIDLRKKRGGFKSVDELVEVRGIGPKALERLRPFVTVSGKTTARIE